MDILGGFATGSHRSFISFRRHLVNYLCNEGQKPRYAVKTNNLIESLADEFEKLKVIYDGQEVENLTVTKVAFLNAGRDTIKSDDIASSAPVEIVIA